MNTRANIFQGNVKIFLQGKKALQPIDYYQEKGMDYFIGSPASKIKILDFRSAPKEAAMLALAGKEGHFAEVFNQPSWVEVRDGTEGVEIEIHESSESVDHPVLWLGVIYDHKMAIHETNWEVLKSIGRDEIAFAALVR